MLRLFQSQPIPHYHGDAVRRYFIAAVALAFIALPLWGEVLPVGVAVQVLGGIVFIVLAGLTAPHSKVVLLLDVIAAALGVFLLEMSAIFFFKTDSVALFIVREIDAILLALALYAAVKTIRAMSQGKIGATPVPNEFRT